MSKIASLLACTVCSSETGAQVRAAIFDDNFWTTLASVAAPFPILLLGLAVYQFGLPPLRRTTTSRRATGDLRS
jgi:hypothetical protein